MYGYGQYLYIILGCKFKIVNPLLGLAKQKVADRDESVRPFLISISVRSTISQPYDLLLVLVSALILLGGVGAECLRLLHCIIRHLNIHSTFRHVFMHGPTQFFNVVTFLNNLNVIELLHNKLFPMIFFNLMINSSKLYDLT